MAASNTAHMEAMRVQNEPMFVYNVIVENNPQAVALRMRTLYGINVLPNKASITQAARDYVQQYPGYADQFFDDILSVDVDGNLLSQAMQDVVINYTIAGGGYKNLPGDTGEVADGSSSTNQVDSLLNTIANTPSGSGESTQSNEGFNWGSLWQASPDILSGILVGFGILPPKQTTSTGANNNAPTEEKDYSWLWWIVGLIVLAIVLYLLFKNRNGGSN